MCSLYGTSCTVMLCLSYLSFVQCFELGYQLILKLHWEGNPLHHGARQIVLSVELLSQTESFKSLYGWLSGRVRVSIGWRKKRKVIVMLLEECLCSACFQQGMNSKWWEDRWKVCNNEGDEQAPWPEQVWWGHWWRHAGVIAGSHTGGRGAVWGWSLATWAKSSVSSVYLSHNIWSSLLSHFSLKISLSMKFWQVLPFSWTQILYSKGVSQIKA